MSNTKTFFCHSCQREKDISLIHKRYGAHDVCERCFESISQRNIRESIIRKQKRRSEIKQNSIDDFDMSVIYLGTRDIKDLTGLSITTINEDIKKGKLKCLRYRRKVLIHPDDSKEYVSLKEKESALFWGEPT